MLRDYTYTLDATLILEALDRFDANFVELMERFALVEFKVITPDSFLWRMVIGREVYYLYAEDYVTSLEMVQKEISHYAKPGVKLEFLKAKHASEFAEGALPAPEVMFRPEDDEHLMEYAIESGHDFVFLCRSDEDPDDALFNTNYE